MKYLIALLMLGGCAAYTPPAQTVANYTGGQYDETGQNPAYPYNTPHGGGGGDAAGF